MRGERYSVVDGKLHKEIGCGYCLMQSVPDEDFFYETTEENYCPDHFNRKKDKDTLENWLEKAGIILPQLKIK